MKSEETKNSKLQKRVAKLERVVGQKQLEIDFLNKLLQIGSSDVFALCGISRQAHFQALQRQLQEQQKAELYVRSMQQIRKIHPGMGLRTMYEMLQPEGIGRDAFAALGLQEGFRLKSVENKPEQPIALNHAGMAIY